MPSWEEMRMIFEELHLNPEVRVIVLSGEGKTFHPNRSRDTDGYSAIW